MTSDLSWKSEAPSTRDSIITALSRFTLHKMSLYCPLLHRLLGLDLLLSLKSVHVTLEEVAVGQLELVDILSVDDGRNFLVLVDCSHEAHVLCWSWVRRRGWRYLGILQTKLLKFCLHGKRSTYQLLRFLSFSCCGSLFRDRFCSAIISLHTNTERNIMLVSQKEHI